MKLYYTPGACSMADHIALEWIGKPYQAERVSKDQRRSPEYLKINPAGAVPALQDGDWVLTQNTAILNYLADTFPESALGGDGSPKSRAEVNKWLSFANSDIHPAFHPLFGLSAYLGSEGEEKAKDAARKKLRGLFERADQQLDGKDWLTGSRSIADPYLFVVSRWAKATGVDLGGLANLERYVRNMEADSAVQKVLNDEGLT